MYAVSELSEPCAVHGTLAWHDLERCHVSSSRPRFCVVEMNGCTKAFDFLITPRLPRPRNHATDLVSETPLAPPLTCTANTTVRDLVPQSKLPLIVHP